MLYSLDDVADLFHVSKATIRRWIREGMLETIKIGRTVRIKSEEVDKLLNKERED